MQLRFMFLIIALTALTLLQGCYSLDCPDEYGTPQSRQRWCGPGNAGA
ncbi:MAG: hypothetical protein QM523_02745 [Candidatus Pacebacteria bacterium]|nr:hypothetical protein [Candidatus Paceibacterota bacterium]